MTAQGRTGEAPERPVHEWKHSVLSVDTIYWIVGIMAGVLGIGLAPAILSDASAPQHVSGGIGFDAGGVSLVLIGTFMLRAPARAVREYRDGRFEFVSRRRSLIVPPGRLISVRCIWMDPVRLLPMLVKADKGWILFFPRVRGACELFRALKTRSPSAYLVDPGATLVPLCERGLDRLYGCARSHGGRRARVSELTSGQAPPGHPRTAPPRGELLAPGPVGLRGVTVPCQLHGSSSSVRPRRRSCSRCGGFRSVADGRSLAPSQVHGRVRPRAGGPRGWRPGT